MYIIGFIALWFHMNHGFWSMFHSIGWDNNVWIERLKKIGCWWTTIVVALFIAQAVVFTVLAHQDYYTKNGELQEQYAEFWGKQAEAAVTEFRSEANKAFSAVEGNPMGQQEAQVQFVTSFGPGFVERANTITEAYDKQCPEAAMPESIQTLKQLSRQISQMMSFMTPKADENASENN